MNILKITIDKENLSPRVTPLHSGDVIFIKSKEPVAIGDKYKNYPARVSKVFYKPRQWWQFFKKKEQIGFTLKWV